MSDTLPKNSEDPDALPVNQRSSAFIDGVAFLNFVRLKSLVVSIAGSAVKSAPTPAGVGESLNPPFTEKDHAVAHPAISVATEAEIEDEDWDSLFGAIEERLRDTVDTLDSTSTQLASQDKLSSIKLVVLDCVSSLDVLHKALRHDRCLHLSGRPGRDIADVWSASSPTTSVFSQPKKSN